MKSTFEELGGTYRRVGDYYLPNITVPEDHHTIGKYGRRHHRYMKEHREIIYNILVLNGTLFQHLHEIDTAAYERMEHLIRQMSERQDINEELKHRDQMGWVRAMNNIHACAEEIVLAEVVYT